MIYILVGDDFKKKNAYIKKISNGTTLLTIEKENINRNALLSYSSSSSLFGDVSTVLIEDFFAADADLSKEDLEEISKSKNLFVFLENKPTLTQLNKYKKISTIENFVLKKNEQKDRDSNFAIADSFAKKNKFGTWNLYKNAISKGASPEEISGIIFWKIKTMMASPNKYFSKEELKIISSKLVGLYHDAHLGKKDFSIGLEQFILSVLNKK